MKIVCRACGHSFPVRHPGREAVLKYTCPSCHTVVPVRFKSSPAPVPNAGAAPQPKAPANAMPGTVIAGQVKTDFGGTFMASDAVPERPVVRVTVRRPLLPDTVRDYPLGLRGSWTLGRRDDETPSDISITGDPSVSRRSAVIEACPRTDVTSAYCLRVVKTLNPIRVNDREVGQGESVGLAFGDIIRMGQTYMQFLNLNQSNK